MLLSFPNKRRDLCPGTVEIGKLGISEYSKISGLSKRSASPAVAWCRKSVYLLSYVICYFLLIAYANLFFELFEAISYF